MNNNSKLLIMFAIIIGIFFMYTYMGRNNAPVQTTQITDTVFEQTAEISELESEISINAKKPDYKIIASDTSSIRFETDKFYGNISTVSGAMSSISLKEFPILTDTALLLIPSNSRFLELLITTKTNTHDLRNINFSIEYQGNIDPLITERDSIILSYADDSIYIKRIYIFTNDSYFIEHIVETNIDAGIYTFTADKGINVTEKNSKDDLNYFALDAFSIDNLIRIKHKQAKDTLLMSGNYQWMGLQTKYFFMGIEGKGSGFIAKGLENRKIGARFSFKDNSVRIYAGPIDYKVLSGYENGMDKIVNFGWALIAPISRGVLLFFSWMYSFIPNYGFVIIVFAIVFILVFSPLTFKSYASMRKMQMVQPKLKKLQKKYKKDPTKLNSETMKMYKKHKVNPFTGCLPLFIQMPVFFALYQILRTTIELRGAPFIFWIVDLSAKDPYFVLPILTGITMFFSQKLSATGDQQKMLTYTMPIIMTVFFLNFPSGVVVYWFTYNMLSLVQQYIIRKRIHNEVEEINEQKND